jgi:hypothetical protein
MTRKRFNCNIKHCSNHEYTVSHQTYSGFRNKGGEITMSAADLSSGNMVTFWPFMLKGKVVVWVAIYDF